MEGHVIDAGGEVRQEGAHPAPALAVSPELEAGLEHHAGFAGGGLDAFARAGIKSLPVPLQEFGFVIEKIHLAGAPVHEELYNPLCPRRVMGTVAQRAPGDGICQVVSRVGFGGQQALASEELRQGNAAQAPAEAPEEIPAGQRWIGWEERFHGCNSQLTNMNSLELRSRRQRLARPCFSA